MLNKPLLSIVLPCIRPDNLDAIYKSIELSATKKENTWELVIVGPYDLPETLKDKPNVKFFKDWGSGVRASCIASNLCEGKLVTWSADDALFIPEALDKNIELLLSLGKNERNVVVAKYYEGQNGTQKPLQPDGYFKIGGSPWTYTPYVNPEWWLFNVGIMYRSFFDDLGGWDASYQGTFYSHTDIAIRAQADRANVVMSGFPLLDCHWGQDDHAPIENAQTNYDKPLYFETYGKPDWTSKMLPLDDWKKASQRWKLRFGDE